jgi:hypothetical protein
MKHKIDCMAQSNFAEKIDCQNLAKLTHIEAIYAEQNNLNTCFQ